MNRLEYIKAVEQLLTHKLGLDISSLGEKTVHSSIENHIKNYNYMNLGEYYKELTENSEFLQSLIENIVVPETWFFRDLHPFLFLRDYVNNNRHALLKDNKIKVLSVPCSTGEEPYSIAIILNELGLHPTQFQIDAIDISINALNSAMKGIYTKTSFREKIDFIFKYFSIKDNQYYIDEKIKKNVNFLYDNILATSFLKDNEKYNIILCRNLLIYLNNDSRAKLINTLKQHLEPEGILLVGHSETHLLQPFGFKSINIPKSFAFTFVKNEINSVQKEEKKSKVKSKKMNILSELNFFNKSEIEDNNKNNLINKNETLQVEEEKNELSIERIKQTADSGNLVEASHLCKEYIKIHPTDANAYFTYGLINQGLDNINVAIDNYEKAIYLDPNHYDALIVLSILLENSGDIAKANLLKERAKRI